MQAVHWTLHYKRRGTLFVCEVRVWISLFEFNKIIVF